MRCRLCRWRWWRKIHKLPFSSVALKFAAPSYIFLLALLLLLLLSYPPVLFSFVFIFFIYILLFLGSLTPSGLPLVGGYTVSPCGKACLVWQQRRTAVLWLCDSLAIYFHALNLYIFLMYVCVCVCM